MENEGSDDNILNMMKTVLSPDGKTAYEVDTHN